MRRLAACDLGGAYCSRTKVESTMSWSDGRAVSAIAAEELMSESEIRLHLELGAARLSATEGDRDAVRA